MDTTVLEGEFILPSNISQPREGGRGAGETGANVSSICLTRNESIMGNKQGGCAAAAPTNSDGRHSHRQTSHTPTAS